MTDPIKVQSRAAMICGQLTGGNFTLYGECIPKAEKALATSDAARGYCPTDGKVDAEVVSCFKEKGAMWSGKTKTSSIPNWVLWGKTGSFVQYDPPDRPKIKQTLQRGLEKVTTGKFLKVFEDLAMKNLQGVSLRAGPKELKTAAEKARLLLGVHKNARDKNLKFKVEVDGKVVEVQLGKLSADMSFVEIHAMINNYFKYIQVVLDTALAMMTVSLEKAIAGNPANKAELEAQLDSVKKALEKIKKVNVADYMKDFKEAEITAELARAVIAKTGPYYHGMNFLTGGIDPTALSAKKYKVKTQKADGTIEESTYTIGANYNDSNASKTYAALKAGTEAYLDEIAKQAKDKGIKVAGDKPPVTSPWSIGGSMLNAELSNGKGGTVYEYLFGKLNVGYEIAKGQTLSGTLASIYLRGTGGTRSSEVPYQVNDVTGEGARNFMLLNAQVAGTHEIADLLTIKWQAGPAVEARSRNINNAADRDHSRNADMRQVAASVGGINVDAAFKPFKEGGRDFKKKRHSFGTRVVGGRTFNRVITSEDPNYADSGVFGVMLYYDHSVHADDAKALKAANEVFIEKARFEAGYTKGLADLKDNYNVSFAGGLTLQLPIGFYLALEAYLQSTDLSTRGGAYGLVGWNSRELIHKDHSINISAKGGGNGGNTEVGVVGSDIQVIGAKNLVNNKEIVFSDGAWDVNLMLEYTAKLGPIGLGVYAWLSRGDAGYGEFDKANTSGGGGALIKF